MSSIRMFRGLIFIGQTLVDHICETFPRVNPGIPRVNPGITKKLSIFFTYIVTLVSRPELVGQKVKLVSWDCERERYGGLLQSGEQCAIRAGNLMMLEGVFAQSAQKLFESLPRR